MLGATVSLLGNRAALAFTGRSPLKSLVLGARRTTSAKRSAVTVDATAEKSPPASASGEAPPAPQDLPNMEEIVSLCKRRGIIFASSEIYNGFAGFYDYGPLGAQLKKNIKDAWWKYFVTRREDVVGLDSSIIHNPTTWKSSGEFPGH